jgi:site-specific DNA-methyltransferase (adenine-specific)
MPMPVQKPGRSKQDYGTPEALLNAIRKRFRIGNFALDIAASADNAVCDDYLTEADNALSPVRGWQSVMDPQGWSWCNPPFANIENWVSKAVMESKKGANIMMLIPSSVGANWWKEHVDGKAYVIHLNGRLTFKGCTTPYPTDCSLLIYTPWRALGSEVWDWRNN